MAKSRGWFQEGRFKRQDSLAIGTGALRKQNHQRTAVQNRSQFFGQFSNLEPPFPICEQRTSQTSKPAKNRPMPHVALGDENRWGQTTQCQDIQVAQMV